MSGMKRLDAKIDATAVVPAQAGTHIPETEVMGPRFRGDDIEIRGDDTENEEGHMT